MQLEAEIHAINKKLSDMSEDISKIKQRNEFDSKEKEELTKVVKDLEISINRLTLAMGKKDGVEEGKYTVIKWVGAILGSIGLAWIFWVTNSTVSNNSDISYLKKEADSKRNIQK
ncbi:MAG TPA: hypothetical protein VIR31_00065 [Nitrososphaeraceae archaeon]